MFANLPETNQKRIVIVGAGFGGLALAQKICKFDFQVVLIDKNNYHQFQPLFYQVAMAGLEPSSISFPIRKIFQDKPNAHVRITTVNSVDTDRQCLHTEIGIVNYDFLVLAMGADTNFYGNTEMEEKAMGMKTISEAIYLRNRILENFERALSSPDPEEVKGLMTIVVVGGGPTGVEVSGTLAEMKRMILPKDYPELDFKNMRIMLYQSSKGVLPTMSDEAGAKGAEYLAELGVEVIIGERIIAFDGTYATTNKGNKIRTNNVVWAAGIKPNKIEGLSTESYAKDGRIIVNEYNKLKNYPNIFAVGDLASMQTAEMPHGHPQVAQPAIQQGELLATNLRRLIQGENLIPFEYKDLGSMATVGRHLAVVDLPFWRFQGLFAWYVWMFVHLMAILGVKNKIFVFINWLWNYFTYDQSLRLIIRPKSSSQKTDTKKD